MSNPENVNRSTDANIDSVADKLQFEAKTQIELTNLMKQINPNLVVTTNDLGPGGKLKVRNEQGGDTRMRLNKGTNVKFLGEIKTSFDSSGNETGEVSRNREHYWMKVQFQKNGQVQEGWVSGEYLVGNFKPAEKPVVSEDDKDAEKKAAEDARFAAETEISSLAKFGTINNTIELANAETSLSNAIQLANASDALNKEKVNRNEIDILKEKIRNYKEVTPEDDKDAEKKAAEEAKSAAETEISSLAKFGTINNAIELANAETSLSNAIQLANASDVLNEEKVNRNEIDILSQKIKDYKEIVMPETVTIDGEIGNIEKETKITLKEPIGRVHFGQTAPKPKSGEVVISATYLSSIVDDNGNKTKTQEWSFNNGKWEFHRKTVKSDPNNPNENIDSGKGKNGLVIIDEKGKLSFRHIDETKDAGNEPTTVGEKLPESIKYGFTTIGIKINGRFVNENFKKANNGEIEKDETGLTHYLGQKSNGEVAIFCFKNDATRGYMINKMKDYENVVVLDYFTGKANGIQYNDGEEIRGDAFNNSGGYLILK